LSEFLIGLKLPPGLPLPKISIQADSIIKRGTTVLGIQKAGEPTKIRNTPVWRIGENKTRIKSSFNTVHKIFTF
jgi:hypothetical protein